MMERKQRETIVNEQTKLWNGSSGNAWVDAQAELDRLLKPFEDMLVDAVVARSRRAVLDVGCGTGGVALAIARRIGEQGQVTGIDISEPMLELARTRAEREGSRATFIGADAQSHAFEPGIFDMIVSRFGVMFFEDSVRAFQNLRRAAKDDAELRLIVWRSPAENPFMTTAERAAAPLLPQMPPRDPDAPGQFGFANEARVRRILKEGGWTGIDLQPIDVTCVLPADVLRMYVTRLGPVGKFLQEVDEATRARVTETVLAAFKPYVHGPEVRFTAACWSVGARAGKSKALRT
jgi:SAM-dependent methyltransferase